MAGFRATQFPLGLSATPVVQSYGFRTVLPFFSAGAGLAVVPPEPPASGGGGGPVFWKGWDQGLRDNSEEDEIMVIVMAFLGTINGR